MARQKLTHTYYTFASYLRREGHLYEVFLVLAKGLVKKYRDGGGGGGPEQRGGGFMRF